MVPIAVNDYQVRTKTLVSKGQPALDSQVLSVLCMARGILSTVLALFLQFQWYMGGAQKDPQEERVQTSEYMQHIDSF